MNTKKLFTTLAAIGFASVGLIGAHTASAAVILNAGNADCSGVQPAPNDQPGVEADFKLKCATGDVSQLYKSDFGGSDSGPYADSYDTDFSPGVDPSNADIMYVVGPGHFRVQQAVRPGEGWRRQSNVLRVGYQRLERHGHVVHDRPGTTSRARFPMSPSGERRGAEVPEPGPIGLLGAGLIALYFARRRIAAR
jgi:hypothetical protein